MIRAGNDGAVLTCSHVIDNGVTPEVLPIVDDDDLPVESGEQSYVCKACHNLMIRENSSKYVCVVHKGCLEKVERVEWWK